MKQYILTLSIRGTKQQSGPRIMHRNGDAEAIDAAMRWLRLHRNTHKSWPLRFDQWTVSIVDAALLPRIIATGGVEGQAAPAKRTAT